MRALFIQPTDGRLRAGWRIALFLLLFVALSVAAQLGVRAALGSLRRDSTLILVILAVVATLAVAIARRWLDRRSFIGLGLTLDRRAGADLLFGFALSGAMAAVIVGTMALTGQIEQLALDRAAIGAVLLALLPTVLIGYWEELVFRGYLLQNMIEGMGQRVAVVVSCLLYGAVHAFNPNAGVLSTAIIVLFGYLRLYGYLSTGQLWLSMGMHIAWNWFQGPVAGFAASGHASEETLLSHVRVGPEWLTGGDFGPEGSLITLPAIALALAAMRWWSRRGGLCVPQAGN